VGHERVGVYVAETGRTRAATSLSDDDVTNALKPYVLPAG
jgi:hypothetical protein